MKLPSENEFKVNEYITLKLEGGKSNIYVKGELFQQCKFLLLNIPVENISFLDEIESVDEASEKLNQSLEGRGEDLFKIPPEVEFWGHCSNLQVWVEMNYDTRLLHKNIAFPLLKKLTEVDDPNAKKVFKEEIGRRLLKGPETTTRFLLNEGYQSFLSNEEITQLIKDFEFEKTTDAMSMSFLLFLHNLAENDFPHVKEQIKKIIIRSFLNEEYTIIRFLIDNGFLRSFKLYTYPHQGFIFPYLAENEIKELIEQLNLTNTLNLESKLLLPILRGLTNLGSSKAKTILKEEIQKRLIYENFDTLRIIINSNYLDYLSEGEVSRLFQKLDLQKITSSQSLEIFPILKKMELKRPEIKEILKEEISKRFLKGEYNTVRFLMGHHYLYYLSEEERKHLIERLNFNKIIEEKSPQIINTLERLAEMGSKKARSILEKEVIKRFLRGDFKTIESLISRLSYLSQEKVIELLKDFNFNEITTEKPKKYLPVLLKIAQLGSPEAIEVLKTEVKNIIQNGIEEKIIFLMNSVGSYIDIDHYFHYFTEKELDNIFRSLDYEKLVERKFEMLNIPEAEKHFLIELQKFMKKQYQILTSDYKITNNHIVELNISNKPINMLPESICYLTALKELNLNFNNLKTLPDSIGELKSLVSLKAIDNNLEFLPESIKKLKKLEYLDLRFNQLKEIPDSIGELKELKWISLCCNNLEIIPMSIGSEIERRRAKIKEDIKLHPHKKYRSYRRLNKIKIHELNLSGNNIKEFPLSKYNSACEALDLSDTPFLSKTINLQNLLLISHLNKVGISSNNHWREKLKKIISSYNIDLHERIIEAVKYRFCIKRHYIRDETNIDIGVSKFGGNPDVPSDFNWPYWAGRPLSFLMQLNIADMNQFREKFFSVQKGILYFFYDSHQEEWGVNPLNKNAWRIIYINEKASNLKRRINPSNKRRYTYPTCLITLYQDISLPRDPHHIFPDYSYKEINEINHNYYEFYSNTFMDYLTHYISKMNLKFLGRRTLWSMLNHYLFGYPDEIQEIGIMKGWTQLLQLNDDSIMRWRWGSGGFIHFMIKEEDLKKNYYEDVKLIIDCS